MKEKVKQKSKTYDLLFVLICRNYGQFVEYSRKQVQMDKDLSLIHGHLQYYQKTLPCFPTSNNWTTNLLRLTQYPLHLLPTKTMPLQLSYQVIKTPKTPFQSLNLTIIPPLIHLLCFSTCLPRFLENLVNKV